MPKPKIKTKTDIGEATVKVIRQGLRSASKLAKSVATTISQIDFPSPKLLSLSPIDRKK